ncbi:MAG: ATP-dependent Clp protease ATP-binding subunit [Candidatus Neomarinimicrobiota bacterium]|nr:ATP-dependent Clp protease ATP-binding subunit [Candidatus Neomarinimicrobiota bacterium]
MKKNFSKKLQTILKHAKEDAIRLGHCYVGSEHLLIGLLKIKSGISSKIFELYDFDIKSVVKIIEDLISTAESTMALGHLPLSMRAERVLKNAYLEASSRNQNIADDEHLLLSMLREKEGVVYEVLSSFNLDFDTVSELVDGEAIDDEESYDTDEYKTEEKTPTLDHFSRDITDLALRGKLDPVIGREKEIERVAQVLARRKKKNPVLIGEPGVGKTAIIEGLAQRIVRKTVPRLLHNKRILSLDLAAIVSGTKYRGQFEERLKSIMNELESRQNLIIFIDELHTLVGAGGASGSLDASNMFKPSLARGDIHCIGATTLNEYRKYVEKDGALDRRFQKIIINAPSINESIEILMGLKEKYEEHHSVKYSNNAIEACVHLSERYISDRFLPDKAIDILDETGARAHMFNDKVPKNIISIEKKIDSLRSKKEFKVIKQLYEEAAVLRDEERKLLENLSNAQKSWNEKSKVKELNISAEHVADVVSLITGIPVNKVAESESQKLLNLPKSLSQFIIGQETAIQSISKAIRRARTGLKNPSRPIGAFLFLGPTGVGKTELAKVLAKYLFNNSNALVKVDMSEFIERFSLSRLIGAPPGYVGYDEGGELTEKIRRNPYSVVLLDEIEKAHPDLHNIMLQIFDDGILTDGLGRKIDFSNTIIIMTSNLGTKDLNGNDLGFGENSVQDNYKNVRSKIMKSVEKTFSPELINRIDDTVVFHSLSEEDVFQIIDLQLSDLSENLSKMGLKIKLSISAKRLLAKRGYDPQYGARPLRREIQVSLEDYLSEVFLKRTFPVGTIIKVDSNKSNFKFLFIKKNKSPTKKKPSK